jgi:phosphoenolpyruvate-protein phosphotransferase (PTS system enzyme I)
VSRRIHRLKGIGVSSGFAFGRAHFVDRRELPVPHTHLEDSDLSSEVVRFDEAIYVSCTQLDALKAQMENAGEEHSLILDTHLLMLRDPALNDETKRLIQAESINAEWALARNAKQVLKLFEHQEDLYFQERRADIGFVVDRLMRNLLGADQPNLDHVMPGSVVVAKDLSPADMANLLNSGVAGFVTEVGGQTSHTAIMARSIELPAVVAVEQLTSIVATGDELIVDATRGIVLVNPEQLERKRLMLLAHEYEARKADIDAQSHQHAITQDHVDIAVWGNIESPEEAAVIVNHGASAVGLYRTEYLFIGRRILPDEQEQYEQYRSILETLGSQPATIRTIDLGGDKFAEHLRVEAEPNPAMGTRAIRFCLLKAPEVFRTQLRALLRASAHGRLRLMVPFISRLEEVLTAKVMLDEVRNDLKDEGIEFGEIEFGVMIELPGAALIADMIAEHVDFVSVGTNDLVQYTLGVDRANPNVADLYTPEHPAVLRLIDQVMLEMGSAGKQVSMCGEMAGYPRCVPLLLGMGLRHFSVSPTAIPLVKAMLRELSVQRCEALAEEVRQLRQIEAITHRLYAFLKESFDGGPLSSMLKPIWSQHLKSYRGQ